MRGAEIQNFYKEIIGSESMDLCLLFYKGWGGEGGEGEIYVLLSAECRESSFPGKNSGIGRRCSDESHVD